MRLTGKQIKALECVWDKPEPPNDEAVRAYFAFTDRGIKPILDRTVTVYDNGTCTTIYSNPDLYDLIVNHRFLPVIVEMWKQDFKDKLLSLQDFDDDRPALRELAHKVYQEG